MKFNSILVVCVGNICRSPYAEEKLKYLLRQKNSEIPIISSAGISALVGYPADKLSIQVAAERGLDLSSHVARQLSIDILQKNDLIFVMDTEQKSFIEKKYTFTKGRVHCIGSWRNENIIDPYQKPYEAFLRMADHIDSCLLDWVAKI
ncbi:low molecular weight protein-tyrosine-phosphatase [Fluviispira multicolorata]|uniref:protein-tyrosine-phosphatase n=1 Tax=Fluviispira multicolorata TaxID=2654512 RepID=A0A833N4B3_9BACT|nr:low molecular weight protein-tyrosine-phosphatase [Fluviispira multicolorata]KAB8030666.1 low molecular weight phosphotyrosine protein phosphatase [Fluviispira multicolorata]